MASIVSQANLLLDLLSHIYKTFFRLKVPNHAHQVVNFAIHATVRACAILYFILLTQTL